MSTKLRFRVLENKSNFVDGRAHLACHSVWSERATTSKQTNMLHGHSLVNLHGSVFHLVLHPAVTGGWSEL